MALQARAEATRQAIIDAAVDVFNEMGYGDTTLSDIIDRTKITKGAFYYHFPDKEAVAGAIIEEGGVRVEEATRRVTESASPSLEKLIRVTFVVAEMTRNDPIVRTGSRLRQGLDQISPAGRRSYAERLEHYIGVAHAAVAEGDVLDDIDPDELFEAVHTMDLGCHQLSDALGQDLFAHLARSWRMFLRGIVPPENLPYFQEFVTRQARQCMPPDQEESP